MAERTRTSNQYGAKPRGFAAMNPERRSDIAREGGRAAHEKGTAHQFTPSEARAAEIKSREIRRAAPPAAPG